MKLTLESITHTVTLVDYDARSSIHRYTRNQTGTKVSWRIPESKGNGAVTVTDGFVYDVLEREYARVTAEETS
jgi:hypothetical protein